MTRPIFAPVTSLVACAAVLATLIAAPAVAQNPAGQPAPAATPSGLPAGAADPATVVARVGDSEITAADVASAFGDLPAEYRQMPIATLYPQLLDQLVNRALMLKEGLARKLDEDAGIRAQVKAFEAFAIQRAYLDDYVARTITEEALREAYDTTVGAGKGKEQVKASHILLQSEAAAKAVIVEIDDGADFSQLARDKSTGPSAKSGGDLGYFGREQMVTPFADAAFAMDEGDTSADPVKTQFGWHVIKLTGRRTLPPPAFDEVREKLQDRLTREALTAHMAELRNATTVEMFNPDGSPMAAGDGK